MVYPYEDEEMNLFKATPDTRTLDKKVNDPSQEQSKPTPQPATVGSDSFDLSELDMALSDQQTLMTERQTAETAALERRNTLTKNAQENSAKVVDDALLAGQGTRNQQLAVMAGVDRAMEKANRAIALSNSNNPLDRLQLWALQQSDPGFTSDGAMKEIQFYQSASAALGERGVIQQGAYADQMTRIKTNLGLALIDDENTMAVLMQREQQGKERLAAAENLRASRLGLLQNQNAMQQAALANLTLDQTLIAEQQAVNSPDGSVIVGGVKLSLTQIQTHKADMQEINYQTQVRDQLLQGLALADVSMPQIQKALAEAQASKTGTAIVNGTPVSLYDLKARENELLTQDVTAASYGQTMHGINRNLIREADQRILARLPVPTLDKLLSNGGVDDAGYQYDLDLVKGTRDTKADSQNAELLQRISLANVGDPLKGISDTQTRLGSLKIGPASTSTLGAFVDKQKRMLDVVAGTLQPADGTEPNTDTKAFAAAIVESTNAQIDAAIQSEATRLSNGDKELAEAYTYTIKNQPIPTEVINGALRTRKAANKPLDRWLSASDMTTFNQVYEATKRTLVGQNQASINGRLETSDIEAQAIDTAIKALTDKNSAAVNDAFMAGQVVYSQDNPLKKANISPTQILEITKRADNLGLENFIKQNPNMPSAEAQAYANGSKTSAGLAISQSAALFAELEKMQPGLGKAYVKWWNSDSREVMTQNFSAAQQAKDRSFQEQVSYSLVAPVTSDVAAYNATVLTEGQNQWYASENQRQHIEYVTFQGNPVNKQIFLLDRDKSLTDPERQQIMEKIINPILADAKAKQLDPQSTANYIESSLRTAEPEDAVTRKLLNKLLTGRDQTIEILDSFLALNQRSREMVNPAYPLAEGFMGMFGYKPDYAAQATNGTKWYNEIRGQ